MAKYINNSKFRIVVNNGPEIINFNPGDTLEVKDYIPTLQQFLVNDHKLETKLKVEDGKLKLEEEEELPEDLIVLISDSIVEDLRQEQKKPQTKKPSKRRGK